TLLECRVPPSDPAVKKAIDLVHAEAPNLRYTYSLALSVLFLDRLTQCEERKNNPKDVQLIRNIALQLIAAQNRQGGWNYNCELLNDGQREDLLKRLQDKTFLPGTNDHPYDDNSINQFVMLALWNARKHGVIVEPTLKMVETRYKQNQNPNGSWGYAAKDNGM